LKKVLVINEGFSSNLGDQAIKKSVLDVLADIGCKTDFAYYSAPSIYSLPAVDIEKKPTTESKRTSLLNKGIFKAGRRFLGYTKWYITNTKEIRKILKTGNYEAIIIGGGQLINSSEKVRFNIFSLALYCWVKAARKYTSADIHLMGVGVVDSFHRLEYRFYSKALERVNGIWVRDAYSRDSVKKNFNKEAGLMPDFAFYDATCYNTEYKKEDSAIVGIYSYDEFAAKFDKKGLSREAYYKDWYTIIQNYRKEGLNVKLFYTTGSDAQESFLFRDYIQKEHDLTIEVAPTSTLDSLYALYKPAKKVYSARMHALLLGMKYQCRVEAYLISQKLASFDHEYIQNEKNPEIYSREIQSVVSTSLGIKK
jgi:polysaccharide pyruvyl transferase WcaK-like protein